MIKQDIKVSRITSTFDKGIYHIHVYGYDKQGNFKSYKDTFRNYFYYSAEHIQDIIDEKQLDCSDTTIHETLYGEKVYKVYYSAIKLKNNLKRKFRGRIHEADVNPEFRYILHKKLQWSQERHLMFYDIETDWDPANPDCNKPYNPTMPITSIQAYSSKAKEFYVFAWHPEETQKYDNPHMESVDNVNYIYCKTEAEVILGFIQLVKTTNCDVLTGWYSSGFDMPYIMNRSKRIGIPVERLSPVCRYYIKKRGDYWKTTINGLDHVDMIDALQDMHYKLPNWKLATAAQEIVPEKEVDKLTEVTWKDWKDNFDGFMKYGIRDVEILVEIENKLKIFNLYYSLQEIANLTSLNLMFFKSMIVDNYILKEHFGEMVLPSRGSNQKQEYKAAIVIKPTEPGLHKNVTCVDYTSLYPTTIMAFNLSPETLITSEQECQELGVTIDDVITGLKKDNIGYIDTGHNADLFGGRYLFYSADHKEGMLPRLLRTLFLQRVEINKGIKSGKYQGDELLAASKSQLAIKTILNSSYGAMAFNLFRLYKPEVSDAITFFARNALRYAMVTINNKFGHDILYGDTDSCFFKSNDSSVDDVVNMLDEFNLMLKNEFVPQYTTALKDDYFLMDLKFEYDLSHCYFGESKKRYYSIIRETGKKYIKGMNIIRKDTPAFMKSALNRLAELSVKDELTLSHIQALRKKIESVDYKLLGINKKFNGAFDGYKVIPQHVRGSVWANEKLGTRITHMDTPLLFYIISKCEDDLKKKERRDAICLNEEDLHFIDSHTHIFELDYDRFFRKQVLDQLEEFALIPSVKLALEQYEEVLV